MLSFKNKSLVAKEMGLSPKTFRKRLAYYGIVLPTGHGVCPRWQKLIYETFWFPEDVEEGDYSRVRLPKKFQE